MMYRVGLMPSFFLSLSLSIAHTHKELVSGSLRDDNDGDNIDHSDQGLSSCRIFYSFHLLISLLFFPFFYHTFLLHVGFACRVKWTMSECRHGCQSRNGVSVCRHDVGPCSYLDESERSVLAFLRRIRTNVKRNWKERWICSRYYSLYFLFKETKLNCPHALSLC